MFSRINHIICAFGVFFLMVACSESKYAELVQSEMARNIIHDSLFFGLKFGQTKQEFFDICWKLNKKKLVKQGPDNKFVRYNLPDKNDDDSRSAITMLFYGRFNDENSMTGMDLQFYYDGWSIWSEQLQSDRLIPVIKDTLMNWYPGNDFIKVPLGDNNADLLVKVDGNRRITIKPKDDDKIVKVQIDDLRYVLDK
jgi:hypothetical protein